MTQLELLSKLHDCVTPSVELPGAPFGVSLDPERVAGVLERYRGCSEGDVDQLVEEMIWQLHPGSSSARGEDGVVRMVEDHFAFDRGRMHKILRAYIRGEEYR